MTSSQAQSQTLLQASLEDFRLDADEKADLHEFCQSLKPDARRAVRNQAFALARQAIINDAPDLLALKWLERVIKTIENSQADHTPPSAYFSPGVECKRAILGALNEARVSLDVCVFTISDNDLAAAILKAKQGGITVRVITDNDKSEDMGSDIEALAKAGVDIRMDRSRNHMHHKFAIVDGAALINGSFNWTRSASKYNQENVVISHEATLLSDFQKCFEKLWDKFG